MSFQTEKAYWSPSLECFLWLDIEVHGSYTSTNTLIAQIDSNEIAGHTEWMAKLSNQDGMPIAVMYGLVDKDVARDMCYMLRNMMIQVGTKL